MKSMYYLQADEIDHVTIRYTDFGEPLNREKAVKFITSYNAWYDDVAKVLTDVKVNEKNLYELSDSELYEILVRIRTVLLNKVF
ncbi:MAG: hypothetical protein MJ177_01195 [Clostridia bacterium]|nr:hypothetical protein [Clostridia bacterium]